MSSIPASNLMTRWVGHWRLPGSDAVAPLGARLGSTSWQQLTGPDRRAYAKGLEHTPIPRRLLRAAAFEKEKEGWTAQ